jgi:CheY-like chemotaxis protein
VLIVEDNKINQRVALRMLEKYGIRADVASDGEAALEMHSVRKRALAAWRVQKRALTLAMQAQPYALILMDVQMPRMDGLAATRLVRQREAAAGSASADARRAFIVAITANAVSSDREECLAVGMDSYLSKPISQAGVAKALLKCVLSRSDSVVRWLTLVWRARRFHDFLTRGERAPQSLSLASPALR